MNRIAVIGADVFDTFAWHIQYTLQKMGYNSKIFDIGDTWIRKLFKGYFLYYGMRFYKKFEYYVFRKLEKTILSYNPQLIIVVYRHVPPFVIDFLKKELNAKIIHWNSDSLATLDRGYIFTSKYDTWFVKDRYMESFMKDKLGLNVYYLPRCFNPDIHKPPKKVKFGSLFDVSIAGTLYPYRAKMLDDLSENFNIKIFGDLPRWMDKRYKKFHSGEYIKGKRKAEVFYGSKINLNILHYAEINGDHGRLFEIAGCGGFQICDEKDVIKELFVENKEIILYKNIKDLRDKVAFYLKNVDKAFDIAVRSRKRALKEHTYEKRIKEVFKIIGFRNIK